MSKTIKWTIGIVNYRSSIYLQWQLKIIHQFNINRDFIIVIVDNSGDILENYRLYKLSLTYPNITIVTKNYRNSSKKASIQHGEGLDIVMQHAKLSRSEFLLTLDPDCFLLQSNFLNIFEQQMLKGYVTVGTEYSNEKQMTIGNNSDFPCAFACSYNLNIIGYDVSFMPSEDLNTITQSGKDVGFRIREKFSKLPYLPLKQKIYNNAAIYESKYFPKKFEYYFFQNKLIALHFNKSSRHILDIKRSSKYNIFKSIYYIVVWHLVRHKASKACYNYLCSISNQNS